MRQIALSVEHCLGKQDARSRIEAWLNQNSTSDLGRFSWQWSSESSLTFQMERNGRTLGGQLQVDDRSVSVTFGLPWTLAMFAGQVKQQIEAALRQVLTAPH